MNNVNKIKHLEMIQNIIERMAQNSFHLKAWAVAMVSVIGGLTIKEINNMVVLITFVPIACFWILDAYYLQLERKYRNLYHYISKKNEDEIDFNMKLSQLDSLDENDKKELEPWKCFTAISELIFYLPLAVISGVVGTFLIIGG